ncbi:MAG: hypothetical protein PHE56_08895 [Bacteroidales bacterium]|jgi:hypothetical protein|nr:hypothetical protein [Bacteroidales bacterium]
MAQKNSLKPGPENSKYRLFIEKTKLAENASYTEKMNNREHRYSFPSRDDRGENSQFYYMKEKILENIHKMSFHKAIFEEVGTGRIIHMFINGKMIY